MAELNKSTIIFKNDELVPVEWRGLSQQGDCYVFNPAIAVYCEKLIMAYRVVMPDLKRRIAICRLDNQLNIVRGSIVPFSDKLIGADDWHADPRFCVFGDRLLLHFNNGARRPNKIYLVELDPDTLLPMGKARPLFLSEKRQVVEKNWTLFDNEGVLYAVYWIAPHIVLRVSLDYDDAVLCKREYHISWDASVYTRRYGQLRGGTPPILVGDRYYAFFHSNYRPLMRLMASYLFFARGKKVLRNAGGFYGFSAKPPFTPQCFTPLPALFPSLRINRRANRQLNRSGDRTVYPVGAVYLDGRWIVSYGLLDEYCCLSIFSHEELLAYTVPADIDMSGEN